MNFGQQIFEARKRRHMSQLDLAFALYQATQGKVPKARGEGA